MCRRNLNVMMENRGLGRLVQHLILFFCFPNVVNFLFHCIPLLFLFLKRSSYIEIIITSQSHVNQKVWRARLDWTAQKIKCRSTIAKPAWCKTPCTSPKIKIICLWPHVSKHFFRTPCNTRPKQPKCNKVDSVKNLVNCRLVSIIISTYRCNFLS